MSASCDGQPASRPAEGFATPPKGFIDRLSRPFDPDQVLRRYWRHQAMPDEEFAAWEAKDQVLSVQHVLQEAESCSRTLGLGDVTWFKEGHTSVVFLAEEVVVNIARDRGPAAVDLRETFNWLRGAAEVDRARVARVHHIGTTGTGVDYAIVERIRDGSELTFRDGMLSIIACFAPLVIVPLNDTTKERALRELASLDIPVNLLQGDLVVREDGSIVAVACSHGDFVSVGAGPMWNQY